MKRKLKVPMSSIKENEEFRCASSQHERESYLEESDSNDSPSRVRQMKADQTVGAQMQHFTEVEQIYEKRSIKQELGPKKE